jgi:hypothetical protein
MAGLERWFSPPGHRGPAVGLSPSQQVVVEECRRALEELRPPQVDPAETTLLGDLWPVRTLPPGAAGALAAPDQLTLLVPHRALGGVSILLDHVEGAPTFVGWGTVAFVATNHIVVCDSPWYEKIPGTENASAQRGRIGDALKAQLRRSVNVRAFVREDGTLARLECHLANRDGRSLRLARIGAPGQTLSRRLRDRLAPMRIVEASGTFTDLLAPPIGLPSGASRWLDATGP